MKIHFVRIGGTAMVPLAALLAESGHQITGSDLDLYPPMSTLLEALKIPVSHGFSAANIPQDGQVVVVGNAATRDNAEAQEAIRRGLSVLSLPQAVARYLLPGKISVVVAGTHGKTTTAALTAWLLLDSGRDPGFLVGGQMRNSGGGHRLGRGPHFVLEGDEYNAAFFDRGPKFLHYQPRHLSIGNIEYDHADLFPDMESVVEAFSQVVALVPPEGSVVVNADDARALAVARAAKGRLVRVSIGDPTADFAAADIAFSADGTEFLLVEGGLPIQRLRSPLYGLHNVSNALGAIALVRGLGVSVAEIARCLPRFEGVRRRLELVSERNNIFIVDDFAHHPTAVAGTLAAARTRWPGRRIWALFEPRSNTAGRRLFQEDYARAFTAADALVIAPIFHAKRLTAESTLDRQALVEKFGSAGKPAFAPDAIEQIPEILRRHAKPGDVVILMSSGAFGGLPEKLAQTL